MGMLATSVGWAAEAFVDTPAMKRHSGQILPLIIPYDNALSGKTTFLYRNELVAAYEPGFDVVGNAPKPVAIMAGMNEASTSTLATRLRAAGQDWGVGAAARSEQGHVYRDGNDTQINFGYQRETEWLGGRWGNPSETVVSLAFVRDELDNVKLLNYGLDVDYLNQGGGRMTVDSAKLPGWFNRGGGMLAWGYARVDVDNFTMRTPGSQRINGVGDHQVWRLNGWAAHEEGISRTTFGVEGSQQHHAAKRYGRNFGPDAITAYWVPGVNIQRASAWAEQTVSLSTTKLEGGLRYDLVSMNADDLHTAPQTPLSVFNTSTQQLYERYYGANRDNDSMDHNISGRLRAEQTLAPNTLAFADLSRMVRSPDYTERYNGNGGPAVLTEVGDPQLAPEKHHKLTLGSAVTGGGYKQYGQASPAGAWRLEGNASHDRVQDFVTIDTARGQPGVLVNNGAQVYRNVDAAVSALSADGQAMLSEHVAVRVNLTGQRGRNLSDNRPLHQMAPFEASMFLDTFGGDEDLGWNLGTRLRAVAAKRAVDSDVTTGNGQDFTGPAGAFATLDIYGGLRFSDSVAITAGIDNVFDKLYREHLKATPQTSQAPMPNAPGRTVVLRALVSF
ncbi:MAG: TonB-dependent receptor [Rhodospirillaceae bacterium]|nr:TonB-dependent receptor [Rhodospirillales bacterium]